jgi:hypothetical protein
MTTSTGGSGVGSQPMDASIATERLNELMKATASYLQDQLGRWSTALQKIREGTYNSNQWFQDLVGMWDAWAQLATVPFQLASGQSTQFPTLLLVVDGAAEFYPPQDAPANIFLPVGVTTEVTDLYRVGDDAVKGATPAAGNRTISAKDHVRARFSPTRNRVEVSLVDLGKGKSERAKNNIYPGLYAGAVYATEVSARRPLAIVFVLIEESTLP